MGEIGGEFGVSREDLYRHRGERRLSELLSLREGQALLLSSGRAAIKYLFSRVLGGPQKVLLPAYLCASVAQPLAELGVPFDYYNLNEQLEIDTEDLAGKAAEGYTAVLFAGYFGFPQPAAVRERLGALGAGITLIEDCTHTVFTAVSGVSRYRVASLRKWLGVPDGALLWADSALPPAPRGYDEFFAQRLAGQLLLEHQNEGELFRRGKRLCAEAEVYIDKFAAVSRISGLSEALLQGYDYPALVRRRQANYDFLLRHLPETGMVRPLFPHRGGNDCPLGFPVRADGDRDRLGKYLARQGIHCQVHWPLPLAVRRAYPHLGRLSGSILTLPCDQRYGEAEMARIAGALDAYGKKTGRE